MPTRTIDQTVLPHHFASGNADGGYTTWQEIVADQPLSAAHLAALASPEGYVNVNVNVEGNQLRTALDYNWQAELAHYAPLVFDQTLAPIVMRVAAAKPAMDFLVTRAGGGSGSIFDHQTHKPLIKVSGDFRQVLAAAGYRAAGWSRT